jgi:hypothetical protein
VDSDWYGIYLWENDAGEELELCNDCDATALEDYRVKEHNKFFD